MNKTKKALQLLLVLAFFSYGYVADWCNVKS